MNPMIISIIIMAICIVLFITKKIPYDVAGLLGLVLLVVFKICSVSEAFSAFAGETFFICFSMVIVGSGLDHSGLLNMIGYKVVQIAGNSTKKLLVICVFMAAILSAFLSNSTIVVLVVTLVAGICRQVQTIKIRDLAMPIAFATVFGGQFTLIGTTSQLAASGIMKEYTGEAFSMFTISPVGIPVGLTCCVLMVTLGLPFGRKIWGSREEVADLDVMSSSNVPQEYDKRKLITMGAIMVLLIFLFFSGFVSVGVAAVISAVLTIVTGIVDQKTAFQETDWNILIWLGCILGLPKGLQVTGASETIARWVLSKLDLIEAPMLSFAIIIVFTCVLTHLIANSTCVAILLPIVLEMAQIAGFNPMPFAVGITVMCALAVATPLGAGYVAYIMTAGYKFTDFIKYGFPFALLTCILIILITPIVFPFVI